MRAISNILFAMLMLCLCIATQAQNNASTPTASPAGTTRNLNVAGKVDLVEGDVRIYDSGNALRTVHVNDNIFEGDAIVTGSDGEIHMTMTDTGIIAVRPNTKMRITQYRANGDNRDKGVIGLLVGSFRSISGWIAKYQPKSYEIRTPTATIGIRGTDHEPKVIPEGSTEGDPGTYDKVNIGGTYIRTPQGTVNVTEQHAGFAPRAAPGTISRPRLLDRVPSFFRPTRNEHLLEGKHEEIQRNLQKRREERHQQFRNSSHQQSMQRQNAMNRRGNALSKGARRQQATKDAKAERQQRASGNREKQGKRGNRRNGKKENEKANRGRKNSD